jgi:PAS domain S-box-containing protein
MIVVDAFGTICFANNQIGTLFGYPPEEVIGWPVERLMPEHYRAAHAAHRRRYTSAPRVRSMGDGKDLCGRHRDGTEIPVEISLSPIQDGDRTLIAAAIRDVTGHKRMQTELLVMREAAERAREAAVLAQETAVQAQEIAVQAQQAADRANQGKSRFLATASHDLRQPLQALALLNGSLRRLVTDPIAGRALAQQEHTIAAMSRLLNALLDVSKLESGAVKPEPTDFTVAALFEEMRKEFATLAADKGLELRIDESLDCVHSDPSLVVQILRNLVANAIKYTREGWVQLRCLHDSAFVRIEVLDSGIGIPVEKLPYIYDEFYQVGDPRHGPRDGYGLGLSIVQRVARLLNLKLEVRSEVGKGSAFSLSLPSAQAATAPCGPNHLSIGERTGPASHVLLVEDEPAVRSALSLLLEIDGYRVTAVASQAEALQRIAEGERPDLLVTDYHLGRDETGLQVIASVRSALGTPLKAILMTGDTSSVIKHLPADPQRRIVNKPADADELLWLLQTMLASRNDTAT